MTVHLYEDNAGGLFLTDGESWWSSLDQGFRGPGVHRQDQFAPDARAIQEGNTDGWITGHDEPTDDAVHVATYDDRVRWVNCEQLGRAGRSYIFGCP